MRKPRNIARLFILTLALVGLMSSVTLVPMRPAHAQTVGGSWTVTGSLNTRRWGHTATLLPNGKVLVAGGGGFVNCFNTCSPAGSVSSAELYDPATETWSYTGSLNTGRSDPTATLLKNGQVLVAGGYDDIYGTTPLNSAELYDPATGSWRPTGSFSIILRSNSAILLPNGKVLATGISDLTNRRVDRAELYDPATGTWNITGSPKSVAEPGWGSTILLPNGKALAIFWNFRDPASAELASAELYDPAIESWSSTGHPNLLHEAGTVTLLRNGKALVTGTSGGAFAAELYDPITAKWSITGNPHLPFAAATLLSDGRVLLSASYGYQPASGADLYDPVTGTWSYTSRLIATREGGHTATLLQNGRVLVAGGFDDFYDSPVFYSSAELYTPAAASTANSIDQADFFVRQQYVDFLGREPDPPGFAAWVALLNDCTAGDTSCDRVHVSAAFYESPEFAQRGYFVYRFYSTSFGRKPDFAEFMPDLQRVSGFLDDAQLEAAKVAFVNDFTSRPDFVTKYNSLSNAAYVDTLLSTAEVNLSNRQSLIDSLNNQTATRAQALRQIAESREVYQRYYNQAFVVIEYFGYLRRDPDALYLNWIQELDQTGDPHHMVNGFVNSLEYRQRFGP